MVPVRGEESRRVRRQRYAVSAAFWLPYETLAPQSGQPLRRASNFAFKSQLQRSVSIDMGKRGARWGLKSLLITAALAASASARAEQVVMPFACDARGGEVRLTPSDQRAYRIIGRREHHVFTVCSPTDPNRCRNWRIHRFDVDCGGERVSWLRVADAARRYTRASAFVEGGAMHLRIAPISSSAGRNDPYLDRRWARRAERFDEPAESVIDLPPGFAPTFGLSVSFQGGSGPSESFDAVEGPPPKPEPYGDEDVGPDEDAYASRTERRYAQGPADAPYDRGYDDSRYGAREGAPDREFDMSGLPIEKAATADPERAG